MKRFQVVMFGSGGVGKTALVNSFLWGKFPQNYVATIEDRFNKFVEIDGTTVQLDILDTAGTEQFTAMRDLYIKHAHGFILMYSITDESSFQYILPLIDSIRMSKDGAPVPMVIIGNKSDLESERIIYPKQVTNYLSRYSRGDQTLRRRSVWSRTSFSKVSISILNSSKGTTPDGNNSMPSTPNLDVLNGMNSSKVSVSMPTIAMDSVKTPMSKIAMDSVKTPMSKIAMDSVKTPNQHSKSFSKSGTKKKKSSRREKKQKRPDWINVEKSYQNNNGANSHTAIQFMETSAKEQTNVKEAFEMIVREMIKGREREERDAKKKEGKCSHCIIS